MKNQRGYVPPTYIPLGQSDLDADVVSSQQQRNEECNEKRPSGNGTNQIQIQWSSGICACCDDIQSCMLIPYTVLVSMFFV